MTAAAIINTVIGVYLAIFFAVLCLFYAFLGERRRGIGLSQHAPSKNSNYLLKQA